MHHGAYSEPCHIVNTWIFWNPTYLKPNTYSFKMECFAKIEAIIIFFRLLYLRSLTGFCIRPSLKKYSWTCRVTSRIDILGTLSFVVNPDIFRHIHVWIPCFCYLFRIAAYLEPEKYSGQCQYFGIFRTLTLAYCETCHIENFVIFKILDMRTRFKDLRHIQNLIYLGISRHIQ